VPWALFWPDTTGADYMRSLTVLSKVLWACLVVRSGHGYLLLPRSLVWPLKATCLLDAGPIKLPRTAHLLVGLAAAATAASFCAAARDLCSHVNPTACSCSFVRVQLCSA
jgi:hypothetical protein